jgi:hypothetical protein
MCSAAQHITTTHCLLKNAIPIHQWMALQSILQILIMCWQVQYKYSKELQCRVLSKYSLCTDKHNTNTAKGGTVECITITPYALV